MKRFFAKLSIRFHHKANISFKVKYLTIKKIIVSMIVSIRDYTLMCQ